jgi:hypothetical protein
LNKKDYLVGRSVKKMKYLFRLKLKKIYINQFDRYFYPIFVRLGLVFAFTAGDE